MTHYLEYPPSKFSGGLESRRADWRNPFVGQVLEPEVVQSLERCGHAWESFVSSEGERKVRLTDYCHERLYCGICATSEANERASTWIENFRAVNLAYGARVAGMELTLTIPAALSGLIADREDRKAILAALFEGVHAVLRRAGLLAWVTVMHTVSSDHPENPHLHFVAFYPGLAADGSVLGWMEREAFADRRRVFLGAWNRELGRVCARFCLGDWQAENLHVSYSKTLADLSMRLRYEMRPPLQDAFIHGMESADQLRAAVGLALSFLYPADGKQAFRRIRAGGRFGPRVLTAFFESLGFHKQEKGAGAWVSEGRAVLVSEGEESCTFLLVATGELVEVPRKNVSMAGHGCPFEWVRGPG